MKDNQLEIMLRRLVRRAPEGLLLARMQACGFWPPGLGLPPEPPEEATERERIEAELRELAARRGRVGNPAAALAAEQQRRHAASKQRRADARKEREARQADRRTTWEHERSTDVVYAGLGVSGALNHHEADHHRLTTLRLHHFDHPSELATALGMTLSRLRWLTFHRKGATLVHYHRYQIPKRGGGLRAVSAPKPDLAAAQRWILAEILEQLDPEPEAHGFVRGRSIVTNAVAHCNRAVVVNLDLRDFFPTITFPRVRGLFRSFGYSGQIASLLALLTTEPPRMAVEVDGPPGAPPRRFAVALGERVLPQGAATSPAITNLICRGFDRRLSGLAASHGFTYSRYADDLTFSGDDPAALGGLLRHVRAVIADEGFVEHPTKTRVMRRGRRQEVTGIGVNDKPAVCRRELRTLRAILHNAARFGLESQNRAHHPSFAAYLRGRVEYVCMVDPSRRPQLAGALNRALARP